MEVKVDHQATAEQLGRYAALAEGACRVMVVPDAAAPDVREATTKQSDWAVVTWWDLLGRLMDVNPLVARLERDVRVMASDPGAKAVTRRPLHVLLPAKHARLEVEAGTTGRNWPYLNIAAKDGWVFGQVDRAGAAVPPQFQAKVGFTISPEEQEPGPAAACMGEALPQAWQAAVALESEGRFSISRHGGASKMQKLYGTDFPYRARGYVGDYVGIYSTPLSDPQDALAQVVALGERMLVIASTRCGAAGRRLRRRGDGGRKPAPPFRGATQLPGLRPPRAESAGDDPGTILGPGYIAGVSASPGVAGSPEAPGQLNPLRPRFHHVVLPWNAAASSTLLAEVPHFSSRFHHPRLARRLRLGDRGPAARGLQAEPVQQGGAPADNPSARGGAHAPIGRPCGSWLSVVGHEVLDMGAGLR